MTGAVGLGRRRPMCQARRVVAAGMGSQRMTMTRIVISVIIALADYVSRIAGMLRKESTSTFARIA